MKKKIYWKVYQDKDSTDFDYYIDTLENVKNCAKAWLEYSEEFDSDPPVIEPIFMTEEEFDNLPEFEGF